jgi:hypothetical protein
VSVTYGRGGNGCLLSSHGQQTARAMPRDAQDMSELTKLERVCLLDAKISMSAVSWYGMRGEGRGICTYDRGLLVSREIEELRKTALLLCATTEREAGPWALPSDHQGEITSFPVRMLWIHSEETIAPPFDSRVHL